MRAAGRHGEVPPDVGYEISGRGADLAIDVAGPTVEACLGAAVEAFCAALAEVEPSVGRHERFVTVAGDAPTDLLVGLMDEAILHLDAEGQLAVRLVDARIDDDGLHGALEVVDLQDVVIHGVAPKAATWHGAHLTPDNGGWTGHVMLDL